MTDRKLPDRRRRAKGLVVLAGVLGFGALTAAEFSSAPDADSPVLSSDVRQAGRLSTEPSPSSSDAIAAPGANDGARSETEEVSSSLLERGRILFARQCALCHGEAGDGGGRFAYLMNPRPRNFQKGRFKLVTTGNHVPSDEDLLGVITRGIPGSAMPPWGHLPDADLKALVAYVRSIRVEAARAEFAAGVEEGTYQSDEVDALVVERAQPGPPLTVPTEPPFDDLRWFNGRRIYLEACAPCHGVDGHPVAEAVKFDEEGFPDPPRSFVNGIFKGGMAGPSLYARIGLGMPGTPMPSYQDAYTSDETWDLIHYVQSLARVGSQERAQLRQGTFTASRAVGELPSDPMDPFWNQAKPLYVGLTPLWWTDDRVEGLVVRALHDGRELALRLSWLDPTRDERAVRVEEFRDAIAIQFALSTDPPFYMGDKTQQGGVNIWMWKADRQKNIESGYQDVRAAFGDDATDWYLESSIRSQDMSLVEWSDGAITTHDPLFISAWGAGNLVADPTLNTPVECLTARGPGTLSGKPANVQIVEGRAVYERGVWTVVMRRVLDFPDDPHHADDTERVFKRGDYLPVSFAIWNGSAGDRDGKKSISIWQRMVIE